MIAYITGATGCVGRNLVDILLEANWKIIVLHRKSSDLSKLDGCDVEFREVNLHKLKSVEHAMDVKADALFHIAANMNHNPTVREEQKAHEEQWKDNVLATKNLASVCLTNGVKRFIHTSTGAAYFCDNMSIEEMNKVRCCYMRTKKLAEMEIKNSIENGLDAVILRIPIVVGEYDYNNYSQIFSLLKTNKLKFSIPGCLIFAHVKEIAEAHLAAFENGKNTETYYLSGEFASWHEFCVIASNLMGIKPPRKPLPIWCYYMIARGMRIASYFTNKKPLMSQELIDLMTAMPCTEDFVPDFEYMKTKKDLGYEWTMPLSQSLHKCYDWLVENNKI